MAQLDKKAIRNTKVKESRVRNRFWFFTHNNYTEDDIPKYTSLKCDYCFQEEKGNNGTPHLQGILMYKNAISFNALKKAFPSTHWEICKNKIAAIQYCTKVESRNGSIYTNIDLKKYVKNNDTLTQEKNDSKKNEWDIKRKIFNNHIENFIKFGSDYFTAVHLAQRIIDGEKYDNGGIGGYGL